MNDTKLTFTISYDITADEMTKIANVVGESFCLVPILNGIDIHTYKELASGSSKKFNNLFSWGSSFNLSKFTSLAPEWTYGNVQSGTNTISFTTPDYSNYLTSETDVTLATNIKFCVYKWNKAEQIPTGNVITDIAFSDDVDVSCTFTKED